MSDVTMPHDDSELRRIGEYVRAHLYDWLNDVAPQVISGPQILERMERRFADQQALLDTRFEAQHEVMKAGFAAVDTRFEAQHEMMKAGFAAVDTRFEAVDKRFEAVDKRFEAERDVMKAGFAAVDRRFEAVDKRFEAQQAAMKTQQWIVIIGFALLGTMVSILGLT